MTASELPLGAEFTTVALVEWGVMRKVGQQGNTVLALVLGDQKTWLPNPEAPIWVPGDAPVSVVS